MNEEYDCFINASGFEGKVHLIIEKIATHMDSSQIQSRNKIQNE